MWEASTDFDWQDQYNKCWTSRKSSRFLVVGDVEELRTRQVEAVEPNVAADLASWVEEMDDFGSLLLNNILRLRECIDKPFLAESCKD
jgi:hypothetical protein